MNTSDLEQFESVQKTRRELLQAYEKIPIQPVTIPPEILSGPTECRQESVLLAELPRGVKTGVDSRTLRYGGFQLSPDGLGVFFRKPLWNGFSGGVVFNGKLQAHCEDTSLMMRYDKILMSSFPFEPLRFSPDGRFISANVLKDGGIWWIREEVDCFASAAQR